MFVKELCHPWKAVDQPFPVPPPEARKARLRSRRIALELGSDRSGPRPLGPGDCLPQLSTRRCQKYETDGGISRSLDPRRHAARGRGAEAG